MLLVNKQIKINTHNRSNAVSKLSYLMNVGLQFTPFADPTTTISTANGTFHLNFLLFQTPKTGQTSEISPKRLFEFQKKQLHHKENFICFDHIQTSQQKSTAETKIMHASGLPKPISTHKDCICISHINERRLLQDLAACYAYYRIRGILLFPRLDQMDSMCQLTLRNHLGNTPQPLSFNTNKLIISFIFLSE